MIVIAIIGILAAIALPAYARYMARARFTEVTSALDGVKKQVELCIFDLGLPAAQANNAVIAQAGCSNAGGAVAGNGWRIGAANSYATKFVATITVRADGVVVAQANAVNGLVDATGAGATYAIQPWTGADATNGIIDWRRVVNDSSCIGAELC